MPIYRQAVPTLNLFSSHQALSTSGSCYHRNRQGKVTSLIISGLFKGFIHSPLDKNPILAIIDLERIFQCRNLGRLPFVAVNWHFLFPSFLSIGVRVGNFLSFLLLHFMRQSVGQRIWLSEFGLLIQTGSIATYLGSVTYIPTPGSLPIAFLPDTRYNLLSNLGTSRTGLYSCRHVGLTTGKQGTSRLSV